MTLHFKLSAVQKTYGSRRLFGPLDLDIERGSFVALTGPSGSGKSAVLNLLSALESPDSGTIEICGNPAPKPLSRAATTYLRNNVGYLFQNFGLIDDKTVEENLNVALAYSPEKSRSRRAIAEALDEVGLENTQKRKVHSMSGGEQQRVAIARLLLKPCDVVLADEPTASLDGANRDVVLQLLGVLRDRGKTVVLATHDEAAIRASDREVNLAGSSATAASAG